MMGDVADMVLAEKGASEAVWLEIWSSVVCQVLSLRYQFKDDHLTQSKQKGYTTRKPVQGRI